MAKSTIRQHTPQDIADVSVPLIRPNSFSDVKHLIQLNRVMLIFRAIFKIGEQNIANGDNLISIVYLL